MSEPDIDPRMAAGVDMLGRTGANSVQIRWSDDEAPIVWFAVAEYAGRHETAAGLDPTTALMRLCELILDGGNCNHCGRITGFEPTIEPTILDELICWYQWDPELATFRRSCE